MAAAGSSQKGTQQSLNGSGLPSSIPPIRTARSPRGRAQDARDHSYGVWEALKYFAGADPDLIWGPFYKRFRAARKERANWQHDWTLDDLWTNVPPGVQSRPNYLKRLLPWNDDPPKLEPAPPPQPRQSNAQHKGKDKQKGTKTKDKADDSAEESKPISDWTEVVNTSSDASPSRIDFPLWFGRHKHPEDYDNHFFADFYKTLYERLYDFVEKWFGSDIHLNDWRDSDTECSAWELTMTEQFIHYAREVAHEDKSYISWSEILSDPTHRKWLCMGIFSRIIEKKVFNRLLFGAPKQFQDELERFDFRWIDEEGFNRKRGSSHICRAALGHHLVPADFWSDVDDLTGRSVLIFKPLFMMMCIVTNSQPPKVIPQMWQELHSIMALAGYLQVCMSISPSVFHILSASPGARFDYGEEESKDHVLYRASADFHGDHNKRQAVLADANIDHKDDSLIETFLASFQNRQDGMLYHPLPETKQEQARMAHHRLRGGKVMYTVWPKLTRYTAVNLGNVVDIDVKATRQERLKMAAIKQCEGMETDILLRGQVVYFQGLLHQSEIYQDGEPLEDHLLELQQKKAFGYVLPIRERYWSAEGTVQTRWRWPIWPEQWDMFWLWWGIMFSLYLFRSWAHPEEKYANGKLQFGILAGMFTVVRTYNWKWLDGQYSFFKCAAYAGLVVVLFDCVLWMDQHDYSLFGWVCTLFAWLENSLVRNVLAAFHDRKVDFRDSGPVEGVLGILGRDSQARNMIRSIFGI